MFSVSDRVRQLRFNHVFNIFHGLAPAYLCENFKINQGNTRGASNMNFIIPDSKLCCKNTFVYNSIIDWNKLLVSTKNLINKQSFKKWCQRIRGNEQRR